MTTLLKSGCLAGLALCIHAAGPVPTAGELHRIALQSFTVPTIPGPIGLILLARINNGPTLHLLLDSGAQNLVLDKKAAARSGLSATGPLDLVTAGKPVARIAAGAIADAVDLSGLVLYGVPAAIADGHLIGGVDGVFPVTLLSGYLIRLDLPAKTLELAPLPAKAGGEGMPALVKSGLMFLKGVLNEAHEGYFLLDTGAAYNAISSKLARRLKSATAFGPQMQMQSGSGSFLAPLVPEVLHFRVGTQDMRADSFVAVDLSLASRYCDFEVSGLVGFPALRSSIVTINYQEQVVRIERK